MAMLGRRRALDLWPGFVDALASLLMVMVFVLLVFVIGQFVLSDALSGRDRSLAALKAELAGLAEALSMETVAREDAVSESLALRATLRSRDEAVAGLREELAAGADARSELTRRLDESREQQNRLLADIDALRALKAKLEQDIAAQVLAREQAEAEVDAGAQALASEREVSASAIARIELLNQQLREVRDQLAALNQALAGADAALAERDAQIEDLGRQLNLALARRVQQLDRYRSDFFGRLREVLGERSGVSIVGDRFVFSSEVLFPSASAEVSDEGLRQLDVLASTLRGLIDEMPAELPWVLQVDGHTDRRPISTERFPSNWELSSARALAIVKYLRARGIPADRLAATGYGEFHPVDEGDSPTALARNRRIELKLTSR